jgi:thiol-disulfide isomerase/thioredoxin
LVPLLLVLGISLASLARAADPAVEARVAELVKQPGVTVVHLWATWCPPCRRELPDLTALYERFRHQGFVILAVTDEEASVLKPFLAQLLNLIKFYNSNQATVL